MAVARHRLVQGAPGAGQRWVVGLIPHPSGLLGFQGWAAACLFQLEMEHSGVVPHTHERERERENALWSICGGQRQCVYLGISSGTLGLV